MKKFCNKKAFKFLYNTFSKFNNQYFNVFGTGSLSYLENLEREWEKNPKNVDSKWSEFFNSNKNQFQNPFFDKSNLKIPNLVDKEIKSSLISLINAYQSVGHAEATLCPCK
jgi:2-oxoglutarate dehydrogenase complex dehydrogenase (E1) component-like enzyme